MHLLWISDSPDTPSGFGNVSRFVCEGLARRGHQVNILGWQTRQLGDWNGCKLFPTRSNSLGSEAVYPLLVRLRPEILITLADVWWLPYLASPHVRQQMEMLDTPWLNYFPIDGDLGESQLPSSWIEMLKEVDFPVAMSRYGQGVAKACGVSCEYIPHGVDIDVFRPAESREAAKERLGYAGKFVVLSDSRNQPRKMLPRLLDVFAKFVRQRPISMLHLHTDPDDEFTQSLVYSYDVRGDLRHNGLEDKVKFSPGFRLQRGGGLPLSQLAAYYQAADVHLLASSGEGFGLPTLQAAAAGVVPMASAYSASHELVEGHGEAIAVADWGETEFGIRRALIDVDDAVAKLARLYDDRHELRERSQRSREFAEGLGWDDIVGQWDSLLASIGPRHSRRAERAWWSRDRLEPVVERQLPAADGASVTVRMVKREFGRLETAIGADARGASDVRLPTVPRACVVGGVKVPRRPGALCAAPGDELVVLALQRVFPVLETIDEADRFELAQAVLALNVSAGLPDEVLVDAALFGLPCIGTGAAAPQAVLWPELATDDPLQAFSLARELLTNPGRTRRAIERARETCLAVYTPDERAVASELRAPHALQQVGAR